MKIKFQFGEKVEGYSVLVLNEREVRAAAGILFVVAIFAFMNAWYTGNFFLMKIFIIAFLIDFIIRVLINPKYSPSLILGRLIVSNQTVEYTGAAQKKFAWGIGLVLATIMFFVLIVSNIVGPINLLICLICLTLLFFESSFGICIGCRLYNYFKKDKAQLCPGGICEDHKKEKIQEIPTIQTFIVSLFFTIIVVVSIFGPTLLTGQKEQASINTDTTITDVAVDEDCIVPDWAKNIGHEEQWQLHNGC